MVPSEALLSQAVVSILRQAECFRKLFGVVVEKMKINIKNRIQNLGEGPTMWLHGDTIAQLRETLMCEEGKKKEKDTEGRELEGDDNDNKGLVGVGAMKEERSEDKEGKPEAIPACYNLRQTQFLDYKSAGPGINFRCSQTVIEAISCSLGQYSLGHEIRNGYGIFTIVNLSCFVLIHVMCL